MTGSKANTRRRRQLLVGPDLSRSYEVTLGTDRTEYATGDTIWLELVNGSTDV